MKKRLLLLPLLAGFALSGCLFDKKDDSKQDETPSGPVDPGTDPQPDPQPDPDPQPSDTFPAFVLPEGHSGFFMKLTSESEAIPSYASIYVTGGFTVRPGSGTDWGHLKADVVTLEKFEITDYYYGTFDLDPEDIESYHYQAYLGFSDGLNWNYPSKESQLENNETPEFVAVEGHDGFFDLGEHTFEDVPAEQKSDCAWTFKVTASEAVPEYGTLYIGGDFDDWDAPHELTPNEARTEWTYAVAAGPNNKQEVKVYQGYSGAPLSMTDDNLLAKKIVNVTGVADEVVSLGTVTYSLSEPNMVYNVTLKVTLATAVQDYAKLFISGSFNEWSTSAVMTPNDGRTEWTFTLASIPAGNYTYKVVADYASLTDHNWAYELTTSDQALALAVTDSSTTKTIQENLTYDTTRLVAPAESHDVTLKVTLVAELPADYALFITGSFNEWSTSTKLTPNDGRTEFTLDATLEEGSYNYLVIGYWADEDSFGWTNAYKVVTGDGGNDASFSVSAAGTIDLATGVAFDGANVPAKPVVIDYFFCGALNSWVEQDANYKLTADTTKAGYQYSIKGLTFESTENGDNTFKILSSDGHWYGCTTVDQAGDNMWVYPAGTYDIYFTTSLSDTITSYYTAVAVE